ncbi:MAG: squalene/phytoene synthase family protein [Geminicoccaceae bacterium]|nr:squalene/phytoene synthase family protein [Geminicoccaceae bacterium]
MSDAALDAAHRRVALDVAGAGSSFFWAMRLLPEEKRRGLFAVYAFCRVVDDVADGPGTAAFKAERLGLWRDAVGGTPPPSLRDDPTYLALADAARRFDLPAAELIAVLDGVGMDAAGAIVAPSAELLRLYCRRVAGAVGLLVLQVLGRSDAAALAVALGDAFQRVNILRDLEEDAAGGRLYVPKETLAAAGLGVSDPPALLADPGFAAVHAALLQEAEAAFAGADRLWDATGRRGLRPVAMMTLRYRDLMARVRRAGWPRDPALLRPGRLAKAGLLARALVLPGG